jgi:hypothetical protein
MLAFGDWRLAGVGPPGGGQTGISAKRVGVGAVGEVWAVCRHPAALILGIHRGRRFEQDRARQAAAGVADPGEGGKCS